ncbi:MAG: Ribonuclease 3 [Myxococcota bacterium]|nr:Ribonuclease 3 [Myxococcota bacterium]
MSRETTRLAHAPLENLEQRLGVRFRDPGLLESAITHPSWDHEHPGQARGNYERLEFLGDAVVNLLVGQLLFDRRPRATEGELSKLRAALVNESTLAQIAREWKLNEHIRLGAGEEKSGGRGKDSMLADMFEAVVAAVYLDQGLDMARDLVTRIYLLHVEEALNAPRAKDFKTQLQELTQARFRASPVYRLIGETGPDHDKTFKVELLLNGLKLGEGSGRNKKAAEQAAARMGLGALKSLG